MHKYYISILLLTLLVVTAITYGFNIAGSPFKQKAVAQDLQRISDFTNIKYEIERYYTKNNSLPPNLSALNTNTKVTDASSKQYDYKLLNANSYQLCTEFSEASQDQGGNSNYSNYQLTHKKGYDCILFTLPEFLTQAATNNTPIPHTTTQTTTITGVITALNVSPDNPRISLKLDDSTERTIILREALILNKNGTSVLLGTYVPEDKVVADLINDPNTNIYKATRIQNLSR